MVKPLSSNKSTKSSIPDKIDTRFKNVECFQNYILTNTESVFNTENTVKSSNTVETENLSELILMFKQLSISE